MRINEKLAHVTPYDALSPQDMILLNANESFVQPSAALQENLVHVLQHTSLNRYPDPLARNLCDVFRAYYDFEAPAVVCGNGSDELIQLLFSCLIRPKDRVLTVQPDFSMYGHYAMMANVEEVRLDKDNDLAFDVDRVLKSAREQDVAMIIFSNPNNPTGQGTTRSEVLRLVRSFDGLVVVDEAYMDFWDQSVLGDVKDHSNLIVMRTASKAMGLAALRVGFAVMSEDLARLFWAGKSPYNVGALTQNLAMTVLSEKKELRTACETILRSKETLQNALTNLLADEDDVLFYPSHANFFYIKTPRAAYFCEELKKRNILIRHFPAQSALRISCGIDSENQLLIDALAAIIKGERG